jgi:uncharacterized protein
MNIADELEKLQQLRQSGGISEEEFAKAKAKLLTQPTSGLDSLFGSGNDDQQTRQWAMFLHLSQLLNCVAPPLGLVAPIVLWQIQKTKLPGIDAHGKVVCNWIISSIFYSFVCVPLAFVIVGFPLLMILAAMAIIFPIIGGIKANNGEVWKYPLSIPFFK